MAIQIHGTIKPKNNGSFPVAEAADILMPDGSRLDSFSGTAGTALAAISNRLTTLEQNQSSGGGSSWGDLADKPFYDESWGGTLDTTNGVPEPALYFEGTPIYFVCLAELTKDEFLEGNVVISYRGGTQSGRIGDRGTAFQEVIPGAPVYLHATQLLLVTEAIHIDNDSMTLDTVPGVYYAGVIPTDSAFVLTLSGGITQTLDPKFLPVEAIDARIDAYMEAALGGDY